LNLVWAGFIAEPVGFSTGLMPMQRVVRWERQKKREFKDNLFHDLLPDLGRKFFCMKYSMDQ
jgi:hypothetical protein